MTTDNIDSILILVQKLLKVSVERGASQAEAETAAAKAQDLLFRHNLNMSQVEASGAKAADPIGRVDVSLGSQQSSMWRAILLEQIATTNFCRTVRIPGQGKSVLIGEKSNIDVVQYLYVYLERELLRLADAGWAGLPSREARSVHGRTWKNAFYLGAVSSVGRRLREQMEKNRTESAQTMALVVVKSEAVDAAVGRAFPNITKRSTNIKNGNGWNAGREAGNNVALNRGIERHGNTTLRIA